MSYPPEEFERRYGLKGIAGDYRFPDEAGLGRATLQERIWSYTGMAKPDVELARRLREFPQSRGRDGITKEQVAVDPLLRADFDRFCESQAGAELWEMYSKLAELNPKEVSKIESDPNDSSQLLSVVHGIVSGINPSDINFYLHRPTPRALGSGVGIEEEGRRRRAERRVRTRLGMDRQASMGWVASEETLVKILDQLRARGGARPGSAGPRGR